MAQKIKPLRRSIATHQRNLKPNEKAREFMHLLFQGVLDDDIHQMMANVSAEELVGFPSIQALSDELASKIKGESILDDVETISNFLDANEAHPQSLALLLNVAHGLDGKISQETLNVFKASVDEKMRKNTKPF